MQLSQIARRVSEEILAATDYEIVELLAKAHDDTLRQDEVDEIYEMITDGYVVVL